MPLVYSFFLFCASLIFWQGPILRQRRTIAIKTEQPTEGGQPRERGKISGSSLGMGVLAEKADLLNVLDYIKTLDFVDPIRITLTGCSQGGFVSALAAAEREDEVERLVMYYPALCIPGDARRGQMINAKFDPEHIPGQFQALFIQLSSKYALDVIGMNPWEICGYQKPVLIFWPGDGSWMICPCRPRRWLLSR